MADFNPFHCCRYHSSLQSAGEGSENQKVIMNNLVYYRVLSQWKSMQIESTVTTWEFANRFRLKHFRENKKGKVTPEPIWIQVTDLQGDPVEFVKARDRLLVKIVPQHNTDRIQAEGGLNIQMK